MKPHTSAELMHRDQSGPAKFGAETTFENDIR